MSKNTDIFEQILSASYSVDLPASGVTVVCRRVPFVTLTSILSEVFTSLQTDIVNARQTIVSEVIGLIRVLIPDPAKPVSSQVVENIINPVAIMRFINLLSSATSGLVTSTPKLMERVISDVLIDVTPEIIKSLPAEDGVAIIQMAFSKMDKALIAKQVSDLFFGIGKIVENSLTSSKTQNPTQTGVDGENSLNVTPV